MCYIFSASACGRYNKISFHHEGQALNTQASVGPATAGADTVAPPANAGLMRTTWALVFLIVFLGFDQISSIGPAPPLVLTPWNPALGLCVAAVMRQRAQMLPFVFIGSVLSQLVAPDLPESGLYGIWIGVLAVAETMAIVVGSQWLMKTVSNPLLKNELPAVLLSCLPLAFVTSILRMIFLLAIDYATARQFGEGVLRFWVGDVIGIFIVTPLCWLTLSLRWPRAFELRRSIEVALQAAAVLGAVWFAFGEHPQSASRYFTIDRDDAVRRAQRCAVHVPNPRGGRASAGRSTRAGFPATIVSAGTSLVTTAPAPTSARAPMVTPAMIVALLPMAAPL